MTQALHKSLQRQSLLINMAGKCISKLSDKYLPNKRKTLNRLTAICRQLDKALDEEDKALDEVIKNTGI